MGWFKRQTDEYQHDETDYAQYTVVEEVPVEYQVMEAQVETPVVQAAPGVPRVQPKVMDVIAPWELQAEVEATANQQTEQATAQPIEQAVHLEAPGALPGVAPSY